MHIWSLTAPPKRALGVKELFVLQTPTEAVHPFYFYFGLNFGLLGDGRRLALTLSTVRSNRNRPCFGPIILTPILSLSGLPSIHQSTTMATAGDPSFEALKDYMGRLAESNQVSKVVIVSCLMVLFYDWGEQSICSSKTPYQPPLSVSHLHRLGGLSFPYLLFTCTDQPLTDCYNLGMVVVS